MSACDYCHGIGACPRCWGRAAIDKMLADRERLAAAVATICAREIVPDGNPALAADRIRALAAKPAELVARAEAIAKEKP